MQQKRRKQDIQYSGGVVRSLMLLLQTLYSTYGWQVKEKTLPINFPKIYFKIYVKIYLWGMRKLLSHFRVESQFR